MDFKLFFEAKQEFVDQVKSAVDKVSDRPFNELFAGKERFLVKVYNPKFEKALKQIGYTPYVYDPKKRTINNKPYAKWCNELREWGIKGATEKIKDIMNISEPSIIYGKKQKDIFGDTENGVDVINIHCKFIYSSGSGESYRLFELLPFEQTKKFFSEKEEKIAGIMHGSGYLIKDKEGLIKWMVKHLRDINFRDADLNTYYKRIQHARAVKQTIDQNNIFNYLCFSRHPIDVLRMSDHKGISSCHRLKGAYSDEHGMYAHCAIADAKNDGGVVYLIKGSDGNRIKNHLDEPEVFYDKDRGTGSIQPIGRVRLRRFIDLKTGDDFAVPTMLNDETKYGLFTREIYDIMMEYVREHQSIHKNPPELEYAKDNWVMVGGSYSDEDLGDLFENFFNNGVDYSGNITHKSKNLTTWQDEIDLIIKNAPESEYVNILTAEASRNAINFTYDVMGKMAFNEYHKRYEDHGHGGWAEYLAEIWTFPAGSMATKQIKTENNEWVVFNIRVRTRLFDPSEIQAVINGFPYREKMWQDNNIEPM